MRKGPKRARKFTYGGRAIPDSEKIGFWDNLIGSCLFFFAVGGICVVSGVIIFSTIIAVLFAGIWLFSKLC